MAKAPKYKPDLSRLCESIRRARLAMKVYRENRTYMVKQFAGTYWSETAAEKTQPVNLISLYTSVVSRSLIAKNPRVMLSTFDKQARPLVSAMEAWANDQIEDMRLADTLKRIVIDALFSMGVAKVALATPADAAADAWGFAAGAPFCDRVDLDDFVFDVHARDFSEAAFIGHRFRVPLDAVRDSGLYSKDRKDLTASTDSVYNADGDERIARMGRGDYELGAAEFEDMVDLWEIYLPRRKLVVTLADEDMSGASEGYETEPLRAVEWLGRDQGPYHILSLGTVPGNAMPKGPVQDLVDLHDAANNVYRKLIRQAHRQKEVLPVRQGQSEDGSRVVETNDGEAFRCDGDPPKPVGYGGPNPAIYQLGVHFKDLFSYLGGNLDIMGGLSPQSKTATQDKMLNENSSRAVSDMQDTTVTFTAEVVKSLCWYWHHDPVKVMESTHSLPGLKDLSILRTVTPEQRQNVHWSRLRVKVDPYSLAHSTPAMRAAALDQVVTQVLAPMMGLLQQQGVNFDVNAYLSKRASYLDMPDLPEIVSIAEPPEAAAGGGGGSGGAAANGAQKPANTSREYVRRSLGGDTPQGRRGETDNAMRQMAATQPSSNGST